MNKSEGGKPNVFLALVVKPRPMMSGIRPPARTSSAMVSGAMSKVASSSPVAPAPSSLLMVPW